MKKIEAIVRHHRLEDIKKAVTEAGVGEMMTSEVRGFGHQKGHIEHYRGAEYQVDLLPKTKIELVISEDNVQKVVDAILSVSRTGEIGDGKIFVSQLDEVIRIRTGETGEAAIRTCTPGAPAGPPVNAVAKTACS